jgi:hypothetical protein
MITIRRSRRSRRENKFKVEELKVEGFSSRVAVQLSVEDLCKRKTGARLVAGSRL